MRSILVVLVSTAAITGLGCLDIGGKLDTPIEGGNGGALGGGGLGGADGGLGSSGTYACDHRTVDSTCTIYAAGTSQTNARATCNGTLLDTVCPTSLAVGRCQVGGETDVYYSNGTTPHSSATAKSACAYYGGIFTP